VEYVDKGMGGEEVWGSIGTGGRLRGLPFLASVDEAKKAEKRSAHQDYAIRRVSR